MDRKIDRFDSYMKSCGLNDNKVTVALGLSVGTLGKSRGKNRDLSNRVIEQILNFYKDLNRTWLLTGEGEMLNNNKQDYTTQNMTNEAAENDISDYETWLLPQTAHGGSLTNIPADGTFLQNCERIVSPIKGVDFAITIYGESMSPEYPSGSRVLIKKINPDIFIDWGRVYVLDTCNGVIIKEIRKCQKEGFITCHSINTDPKYADFDVPLKEIYGMYRVLMCLSAK